MNRKAEMMIIFNNKKKKWNPVVIKSRMRLKEMRLLVGKKILNIYIYNVFFQVYNLSTNSKNNLVRHKVMSMEHPMIIKVTIIKGKFAYHCF